ncbi:MULTISPECIES: hypothetical protein [Erysipelothrix]|nr:MULTISPECIES: hypothetical protein [Erysipelothrix]
MKQYRHYVIMLLLLLTLFALSIGILNEIRHKTIVVDEIITRVE